MRLRRTTTAAVALGVVLAGSAAAADSHATTARLGPGASGFDVTDSGRASATPSSSYVTRTVSSSQTRRAAQLAQAAKRLGLPPNGPDFMYEPPPDVPQLQNRDARFKARPLMVSGTERYIDGEYEYTDFIYDDWDITYPDDADRTNPLWPRYGGNAADLFEFRLSTRGRGLAARFTLNTLMVRDSTIATVAFDTDNRVSTGSSTLPRDPGMPFPGTDQVLTTWGTGAEWSKWNGSRWITVPLTAHVDLDANQITVSIPPSAARPTGKWRTTLATGLYDPKTGGWLDPSGASPAPAGADSSLPKTSKIFNLGFRFDETPPAPHVTVSPTQALFHDGEGPDDGAPYRKQAAALAARQPTQYAHIIDFDLLRSHGRRDNVPLRGLMYRIFPSTMRKVITASDANPAHGNPQLLGEGKDLTSLTSIMLGRLQPYALYVPPSYQPGKPAPFTFYLHCDGCAYWNLGDRGNFAPEAFGEARNSLVVMPESRGKSGFYTDYQEVDVLESWADVARHYTLDPTRPAISGGSGGGHGAYRLGLLWPHLFARTAPLVPGMCRGLWTGVLCTGGAETVLANWAENARNLPIFQVADSASELTFYPGTVQLVQGLPNDGYNSLEELGYRYKLWSLVTDHVYAALIDVAPVSEFLGQYQIEPNPFHVTYVRMPSNDVPNAGLVHNRAYWLSGIEVRDKSKAAEGRLPCFDSPGVPCAPLARGVVDAVSLGFGLSDPTSKRYETAGVTNGTAPIAYTEIRRVWSEPGKIRAQNRIVIKATNIGAVTIDPRVAHVDCNVKLDVQSDGPITVTLLGCPR